MTLKRRHFLQFAGSALTGLGLSQLNFQHRASNYGRVLAQNTGQKLALLVGIDEYSSPDQRLLGCVTDVNLQRNLLIHRFGFKPSDIYTLTNGEATRSGILEAFEKHLISKAKPGDVVVFHFSGHGSRVYDPDPIYIENNGKLNGTIVPVDGSLPDNYLEKGGVVKDIMGHTLFLLRSAINTEYVTTILDCCYSGAGTRNEYKIRSRSGYKQGFAEIKISPEEKATQEKWLNKLGWTREEFVRRYRTDVGKGIVLASTSPYELAADEKVNGFSAGAFTYRLTRYLWSQNTTPSQAIPSITQEIYNKYREKNGFKQTPRYEVVKGSGYENKPMFFINPLNKTANAVITGVKGNTATFWLGATNFENLVNERTVFKVVGAKSQVIFKSRSGLVAEGIIQGDVKIGAFLSQV